MLMHFGTVPSHDLSSLASENHFFHPTTAQFIHIYLLIVSETVDMMGKVYTDP